MFLALSKTDAPIFFLYYPLTDLAILKSNVDKLDIDELKNVPSGLSSWRSKVDQLDIGKLETTPVVKKTEYDELI